MNFFISLVVTSDITIPGCPPQHQLPFDSCGAFQLVLQNNATKKLDVRAYCIPNMDDEHFLGTPHTMPTKGKKRQKTTFKSSLLS